MPVSSDGAARVRDRGFTLVELMISIAILVAILLGVTYVFRSVTKSVGAGQSLSSAMRDSRSAHSAMYEDLKNAITLDDPFLIITNRRRSAFLRATDLGNDVDKNPDTVDLDVDGLINQPGEDLFARPTANNYRNCRIDTLGFFTRNVHRKQTGTGTQLVSPMGTVEGYVWYGHLEQAGELGGTTYYGPGAGSPGTNGANFYSSDWVVGRVAMLLSEWTRDQTNVVQIAIDTPSSNSPILLARGATASNEQDAIYKQIESTRNDLVAQTVADATQKLRSFQYAREDWWADFVYRFRAVPQPNVPLNGDGVALSAPLFLHRCRSFSVEYAGDFVTQARDVCGTRGAKIPDGKVTSDDLNHPDYGQVTAFEPDGRVDFFMAKTGAKVGYDGFEMDERVERVRFYGLPRDTEKAGTIAGWREGRRTNELGAVVPLRDMVLSGRVVNPALLDFDRAEFERVAPLPREDYAAPGALPPDAMYVCAWGPDVPRPRYLRVTVTLEDPRDRMTMGQTQEFVYEVNR